MAVQNIDGNWLKNNLNKVFHRECDELYGMMQLIDEAPTLTPPNEPLTCDGCIYNHNRNDYCDYCIRRSHVSDYYRRPPEGASEQHD